jgi:hypothetical protein
MKRQASATAAQVIELDAARAAPAPAAPAPTPLLDAVVDATAQRAALDAAHEEANAINELWTSHKPEHQCPCGEPVDTCWNTTRRGQLMVKLGMRS